MFGVGLIGSLGVITGRQVSGPAYQPLLGLFSGGEAGLLVPSINDARADGKLWQDAAGTTPAVAADDPVGRIDDYSGNGINLTQSTAGFRPLLKQDGNSNWYIQTDGSDDRLGVTGGWAVDDPIHMFIAGSTASTGANSGFMHIGNTATNYAQRAISIESGTQLKIDARAHAALVTHTMSTVAILEGRFDGPGAGKHVRAAVNNSALTGDTSTEIANTTTDLVFGKGLISYGNNKSYGFLIINRHLTASERTAVAEYMASQSGVTL